MAKIVTVHGTFAHIDTVSDPAEMAGDVNRQWWQPGSAFETQISKFVDSDGSSGAPGSAVEFKPFIWNGDNSVTARRRAGSRLLSELKALEGQGEKYCVLAHSHGGSVVSEALLEGASRGVKLEGLQRWITIGTPFVDLRRERFLFLRLPLLLKAMFVASAMLLFMYVFYMAGEFLDGRVNFENDRQITRIGVATLLTALPFITFYLVAWFIDGRQLFFYRKRNRQRAKDQFGVNWLPLVHEDDEAVRGLASLGSMRLKIFHRDFAVPIVSVLSVFMLPLIYLWVVTSPGTMVAIADYLKTKVYMIDDYQGAATGAGKMMRQMRTYRRQIRQARRMLDTPGNDANKELDLKAQIKKLRGERRQLRKTMRERYPNLVQIRRAQRFERRFLQTGSCGNREPCDGGQLCGKGSNILLNAKLLFHLVTDEVSSLAVDSSDGGGRVWWLVRSVIPVLIVPLVFGLAAVAIVLLFRFLGGFISQVASRWLDRQTWFEVRRTALGNDTEAEVAVGTSPCPVWLAASYPYLPSIVGQAVSQHSNKEMAASITRIRAAISEFALNQGEDGQFASTLGYLSWQELIHTSYFQVPEFRKLVARALSESDGFRPSAAFNADPEFHEAKSWLDAIKANASN